MRDNSTTFHVYISNRRHLRPYSFLYFVPMSALDILRQVIHIILGLRKCYREHEFSLWCRIKPKSWKFHLYDYASVNEVDYFSTVDTVTSKAVRHSMLNFVGRIFFSV